MKTLPSPLPIICLMGPTASGKTQLALELADTLPIEIISVDSALIYRDMDIGTAKPDKSTLQKYPHYLIDIRDAAESYSTADFCHDAHQLIDSIHQRNHIPLLVGGTMLYYRSLWQGLSPLPPADPAIRKDIDARAVQLGWQALHAELAKIDPIAAQRIHPNDPQRLQRALEVYYITGHSLTDILAQGNSNAIQHPMINFAIAPTNREILHQRIAQRFDSMLDQGFIEEVTCLRQRGDLSLALPSMRAVGYRQVWEYLDQQYDYSTMREKGIIATRQLAKRQFTWLRSFNDIIWLETGSLDLIKQALNHILPYISSP
jgi:tRNA dimethylallyltransferase